MPVRRKGNRWEVRVAAGGGRRLEQRLPAGATRADAQALEDALKRRVIQTATGRVDYPLTEVLDRWQVDAQRLRSWDKDLRYRAAVLRELVGHFTLSQLPDAAAAVKRKGAEAELKPASVNRYLALLKRLGSIAFKAGWLETPIAQRIELLPGERRRTEKASPAQLRTLLAAADPRLRDAMLLAALTGLRRGELLALTADTLEGKVLVLPPQITKTNRARAVPVPAEALPAARRLPIGIGAPLLRKLWDQARAAAGLPWLRWHDLRRSYGSLLLRAGASLADVRDLLGHGDIKTTSIYLATERPELQQAVRRLPRVLGGEGTGKAKKQKAAKKAA